MSEKENVVPRKPRASYGQLMGRGSLLEDLVQGLDHVGICVGNLDEAGVGWSALLGVPVGEREDLSAQKTSAAFVRMSEAAAVELISPMQGNGGLERFLHRRGDALHHVAFAVTDIAEALRRLSEAGIDLIDRVPRPGAGGHLVGFLHPKAMGGVLVELVERKSAQKTEGC